MAGLGGWFALTAPRCRHEQLDPCPRGSRVGKGPGSRQRRGCGAGAPSHQGSRRAPTPPTPHVSLGTFWKERHPQLLCGKCRAQGALPFFTFSEQPLSPRGQRPVWSCNAALPPGGRSLHITLPLGYTASAATAQVAGQVARAKKALLSAHHHRRGQGTPRPPPAPAPQRHLPPEPVTPDGHQELGLAAASNTSGGAGAQALWALPLLRAPGCCVLADQGHGRLSRPLSHTFSSGCPTQGAAGGFPGGSVLSWQR